MLDTSFYIFSFYLAHQLRLFTGEAPNPLDRTQLSIYLGNLIFQSTYQFSDWFSTELGYTVVFISKLTGVNLKKIRRMMTDYGMSCRNYTDISDTDLKNQVREIVQLDRGLGYFVAFRI